MPSDRKFLWRGFPTYRDNGFVSQASGRMNDLWKVFHIIIIIIIFTTFTLSTYSRTVATDKHPSGLDTNSASSLAWDACLRTSL